MSVLIDPVAEAGPVPNGTWRADPVHSSFSFEVRHLGVAGFRGWLTGFEAELTSEPKGLSLRASAPAEGVIVPDTGLAAHLLSPDYLDAGRHPVTAFTSDLVAIDGDRISIHGHLTLRGHTRPVRLEGEVSGPAQTPMGPRLGLALTADIDRREFEIGPQLEIPGGLLVVGNRVRLSAQLELALEEE